MHSSLIQTPTPPAFTNLLKLFVMGFTLSSSCWRKKNQCLTN